MVWRDAIRSLREASCCSVEVVNGAAGLRVYGLVSSEATENGDDARLATRLVATASSTCTTSADFRVPLSAKSRPDATRRPFTEESRAGNAGSASSATANVPVMSQ